MAKGISHCLLSSLVHSLKISTSIVAIGFILRLELSFSIISLNVTLAFLFVKLRVIWTIAHLDLRKEIIHWMLFTEIFDLYCWQCVYLPMTEGVIQSREIHTVVMGQIFLSLTRLQTMSYFERIWISSFYRALLIRDAFKFWVWKPHYLWNFWLESI